MADELTKRELSGNLLPIEYIYIDNQLHPLAAYRIPFPLKRCTRLYPDLPT